MVKPKEIVVVGAGVIGLPTAISIQEKGGHSVTIIAEILPTDPKSIKYTSHWAGAHHVSLATNDSRQRQIDRETFETMWKLSAPGSPAENCFLRLNQEEYYRKPRPQPEVLEMMPDFRVLPPIEGAVSGLGFTTVTIDTPIYLNYLMSRFQANGGSIIRGKVNHVDELIENGVSSFNQKPHASPAAIIICAGLGARTLGGVKDENVYPIRGQTVLLRAPWIRFGKTLSSDSWTYIIPRNSGDVIVGGTTAPDDWDPEPKQEITNSILQRALALCPEIAPPEVRAVRSPTVNDLLPIVIEEGCGLRPGRRGGIRLEVEEKKRVPIVYNYGHAGYGYISSWGSASIALSLLESALNKDVGA